MSYIILIFYLYIQNYFNFLNRIKFLIDQDMFQEELVL